VADASAVMGEVGDDAPAVANETGDQEDPEDRIEDQIEGKERDGDRSELEQLAGDRNDAGGHDQGEVGGVKSRQTVGRGRLSRYGGRLGRGHGRSSLTM